ncbi:uracil-DNA glycosylase family protein [Methanobacterium aggregans]|uniref:uracil-DNA glycosylase family protein n=1 Tax=Methanobacterium aggregans TaxID=1615586 RepID=UPI001AE45C18|nr:uracil-DNA glycosylase family protein [Methanobacterium aggregans]
MLNKEKEYKMLVERRKNAIFPEGLKNPSEIEGGIYDSEDHIGPWSKWQGNLNADIMLVGQDWGSEKYYLDYKGNHKDDSITNSRMKEAFELIGIEVGYPSSPNRDAPCFFTNVVLGLKEGNKSNPIKAKWVKEHAEEFLKPTIEIVNPKIIITLGKPAYESVAGIYGLQKENLAEIINKNPFKLSHDKLLFAMYHCSPLGCINRTWEQQKQDWIKIKEYL